MSRNIDTATSLTSEKVSLGMKFRTYMVFTKMRLASLVIVSALSGYLFNGGHSWIDACYLMFGGMLVTAAANGSNQIWERDIDKRMKRTQTRPLPMGEMSVREGVIVVLITLTVGTFLLYLLNIQSALLGLFAYVLYVFLYTPLKPVTPWAVFVGAFPGAFPPMLGAIAVDGQFGLIPGVLFFIQFTWQFPHFWAIAWVAYDDYKAGGFSLLPSSGGKSKGSAFQIAVYSLMLIPFSLLPWLLGWTGLTSMIISAAVGAWFFLTAYRLFVTCDTKDARRLMFASFIYLPIIQFAYVFDIVDGAIPQ